jgi:DNA-binding response OmpR family regulator
MRVLLVEDDARLAAAVGSALEGAGFVVECSADGEDAWFRGDTESWSAVVLDLGLPSIDGLTVLRRWRARGQRFPVLILTARGDWHERVEGIDAGADDYLPKPFRIEELLARLRALTRRAAGQASSVLSVGCVTLDTRQMRVSVDGIPVRLSPQEYRLLAYLMQHAGRVVSQLELTEQLYAQDFERDSNAVEVLVGRVRRKLGRELIQTCRGFGYMVEQGACGPQAEASPAGPGRTGEPNA